MAEIAMLCASRADLRTLVTVSRCLKSTNECVFVSSCRSAVDSRRQARSEPVHVDSGFASQRFPTSSAPSEAAAQDLRNRGPRFVLANRYEHLFTNAQSRRNDEI
jgi:hypothetical protein